MKKSQFIALFFIGFSAALWSQDHASNISNQPIQTVEHTKKADNPNSRFKLGVYGEAVFARNFYSNNWKRYSQPELYKDDPSHGRADLPHFVVMMNYDFGKGWSLTTELEFEHGGVGSAIEIEEEETGEFESEIEKGGEFVLEQMSIQKTISPLFNIKLGHIIVPVGGVNTRHVPVKFFGNYRPEGSRTIMPNTWHQTGISVWGKKRDWRYEVQLLPGLDAFMFSDRDWIGKGATSTFEFKIANSYAGVLRVDNTSIPGLTLGVSGYIGKSGNNSLKQDNYNQINGIVSIGSFDFMYNDHHLLIRGSADYGNLTDSDKITRANINNSNASPSPKTPVAKAAANLWVEAGYNLFGLSNNPKLSDQKLYLFGLYNFYDTMYKTEPTILDNKRFKKNIYAVGLNYFPINEVVIKAEFTSRMFDKPYNTENSFIIGVAFTGLLIK
ncbi:MAG: hypothetical protein CSA01_00065 [Bacteroidetes bacterium]|nr:MAG: hypothetical protein CSA01_00065 [Bacteroidota bacterium]